MSEQTQYQRLCERFPAEDHKTRRQGTTELVYLPGEKVIGRLNDVLGVGGWSFKVIREGATETEAWVLGELTAQVDGQIVIREQYGNQDLARGQHATTDRFKSAATDAIKKTATTIGVGLYLYDVDERREVEEELREAKRPTPIKRAAPSPTPPSCADCSSEIKSGTFKDGKPFTADDAASWGLNKHGRALCSTCYKAASHAAQRAEAMVP